MSDMDHLCFDTTKIDKIQDLLKRGVTVYPYKFERTDTIDEIKERFSDIGHAKSEEQVSTAGRIYVIRQHGKTIFADMGDSGGRIQLYLRKKTSEEAFSLCTTSTPDIIGVSATSSGRSGGSPSVDRFEITRNDLSPSGEVPRLRVETRYQRRYST